MYDSYFATTTIGSDEFRKQAEKQVRFLLSKIDLQPGATILDVPCGTGRHSKIFAQSGYKVTGLDISKACISISKSKSKHPNVSYLKGDMANLAKFKGQYDLVVNLFTSFGYFQSDKENEQVLKNFVNCLKPRGRLVINTICRDWILKFYQPSRWTEEDGNLFLESSKYDKKTKYLETQIFIIEKQTTKAVLKHYHYHRVRLYSKGELVEMMRNAGLKNIKVYGDFHGKKYSKSKSTHPIYIGIKK